MCHLTDRINCDYGQSMSYQVNHSCAVVKKKVKKKNPYKTSPQDPAQASVGEMRMKTQLLPSLWAMICSPKGQDLMRIVISVQICRFSENSGKYIVFVAQWERKDKRELQLQNEKRSSWSSKSQNSHRIDPRNWSLILTGNMKDFLMMNSSSGPKTSNISSCLQVAFYCKVEFA